MKISICCIGLYAISALYSPVFSVPIALIPTKISPTAQELRDENSNQVKYNLIQSSEDKSLKEPFDDTNYEQLDRIQTKPDSSKGEVKAQLSKFYRNGYSPTSRSQISEDAIIFPSTSSSFLSLTGTRPVTEDAAITSEITDFSHIQLPRIGITSQYGKVTLRNEKSEPDHHRHPILPTKIYHETEEPSYEELLRLLASLLAKFSEPAYSEIPRPILRLLPQTPSEDLDSSIETNDESIGYETTTVISKSVITSQEVEHYSLYSGPKIKDTPCPAGQQRTHTGHCQGKSRRLANSSG